MNMNASQWQEAEAVLCQEHNNRKNIPCLGNDSIQHSLILLHTIQKCAKMCKML